MGFDPDTLFFAAGISAVALALTMLGVWLQNRLDRFLIGWMLGMLLLGSGVVIYATVSPALKLVVAFAFALEIIGFVAVYVAARLFTGHPVRWRNVFVLGAAVTLAVMVPIVAGLDGLGIMVYNALAAVLLAMCAWQYWQAREEAPFSITAVTGLYALTTTSFLACSAVLFYDGQWALEGRPDNWAENLNAIMSIAGITGIGALSLGLNQSRAVRRHRQEAQTDSLTGLLNRRALFGGFLERKLSPGDAVIVFDLDKFKAINDQYGHYAGDQTLRLFADQLRQNVRRGDLAARLGGEEFVLVMYQAPLALAAATAEQIRAAFASTPLPIGDRIIHGTASAGIAFAMVFDEDFEQVLHRADIALYSAKNSGRDRVFAELQVVA